MSTAFLSGWSHRHRRQRAAAELAAEWVTIRRVNHRSRIAGGWSLNRYCACVSGQRNRLMILVGSIFAVVGLILGTVFVLVGSQDYSSYTARADATVVEVDVDISRNSSGERTTRTSYDVEFVGGWADRAGRRHRRCAVRRLRGR